MNIVLRRLLLVGAPLAVAGVLMFHPTDEVDTIYESVRPDVGMWIFVHFALLFGLVALAYAVWALLDGIDGRAAKVARIALAPFLVFYTAWEMAVGLGTGVLTQYAKGLPAGEEAAVSGAIQDINENLFPVGVALIIGSLGWIVAAVCAAIALHKSGAGLAVTVLVGLSAAFVVHPPPVGPPALVAFALAAALVERSRARATRAVPATPTPAVTAT